MQTKLLHNDSAHLQNSYWVCCLGFEASQEAKLKAILELEYRHNKSYVLIDNPSYVADILLVNYDNPAAISKKDYILAMHPRSQVVAVSRGPLSHPPTYHIRGIVTAARLLGVFDAIKHAPAALTPSPIKPAALVNRLSIVQIAPAPRPASLTATRIETIENTNKLIGYRALVVDDSLAIQKSIEMKLVQLEQISRIDFADSGEEALAKATQNQYDLIFLDVMMPGIDGYETCTQLRKQAQYKRTPIIMVSGKTSPLDEVKGVMAGCTTYLTKPVQEDAFSKLSQRVLAWLTAKTSVKT